MHQTKISILIKNTKWVYISKIFSQFFGLLAIILVIRQLDVDVFGTYNLLLSSFVVFEILALSAVSSVFNRFIPELIANNEFNKLGRFIRGGYLFSFILFTSLVVLLYFFKEGFATFFNINDFDKYLIAFLIFSYSNFLQILVSVVLKALLLHKKTAIITIFGNFFRLVLYLYFAKSLEVNLLLYIETIICLIIVIASVNVYFIFKKKLPEVKARKNVIPVTYKRVRKYGLLSMINELGIGIVGKTSDYFIVAAMANPIQVGLLAFGHRVYGIIFKILPFKDIQTIINPLFFQKYSGKYDIDEFKAMYSFIIKILLPIYVFPALYFFFFGKSLTALVFDIKYLPAYWITFIMLFSNLFLAFFFPLSLTAQLKERMDILLISKIVVFFSIAGGIIGMKYFGIIGVVMASFIGDLLKNILILGMMRKYEEIQYNLLSYKKYLYIFISFTPFFFVQNIVLKIFPFIALTIIFFVFALLSIRIFDPFNEQEKETLDKIISSFPVKVQPFLIKIYR